MIGAGSPAVPRNSLDCDAPIRRRWSAANSGAAAVRILDWLSRGLPGSWQLYGELLEPKLAACGFTVLNRGKKINFPSTGQQNKFREAVRQVPGSKPTLK
jgi:hypothetical protein